MYANGHDYQGLFGYSTGTIKNVTVSGQVGVWSRIGGICGYNSGTVKNCLNSGAVTTSGGQSGDSYKGCGGICGKNDGEISSCYNIGSVTDSGNNDSIGGICGVSPSDKIQNCYYLDTCGALGTGTSKTAEEFATGEVTKLLQGGQNAQIWGQTAGNGYPELTTDSAKKYIKSLLQHRTTAPMQCNTRTQAAQARFPPLRHPKADTSSANGQKPIRLTARNLRRVHRFQRI